MKAFTVYPKDEINLRLLLAKLQNYGKCNCDFETFCQIYNEWHLNAFPGCPVSTTTANFRNDWFMDFVNYMAGVDLD